MTTPTVVLTADYDDGSTAPIINGHVTFQLSTTGTVTGAVIGNTPVRCTLSPDGQLVGPQNQAGCPLVPNDIITPAGTFYVVTESLAGGITNYYTLTLTSAMAPTVDRSSLTPGKVPNGWTPQ